MIRYKRKPETRSLAKSRLFDDSFWDGAINAFADSFYDQFFNRPMPSFMRSSNLESQTLKPRTLESDFIENTDNFVLTVDVPGVSKEDLDINVKDNMLNISFERKNEECCCSSGDTCCSSAGQGKNNWYGRSYGKFSSSMKLNDSIDVDRIEAELRNGVLTLTLPKKANIGSPDSYKIPIK